MNLQITLILMSVLLVIMFGLLLWVIRMMLNKKEVGDNPRTTTIVSKEAQQPLYSNSNKPKYASYKLPLAEKERYTQKVIAVLEQEKFYQRADLTIKHLAKELDLPKHHLSQIINEQLGTNFIDLINRYRVEAAKEKLQASEFQELNIPEIGQKVGFKAKSTFYAAFKKYTGSTPGDFRKGVQKLNTPI